MGGAGNLTTSDVASAPVVSAATGPRRVGCESTMEAAAVCALCPAHDDGDDTAGEDTALEIPLPDGLPYLGGTDLERRAFAEFLLSPTLGLTPRSGQLHEGGRGGEGRRGEGKGDHGDGHEDQEGGALYATVRSGTASLCVSISRAPNMTSSLSAIGVPISSDKVFLMIPGHAHVELMENKTLR